jgi:hypothetical protein
MREEAAVALIEEVCCNLDMMRISLSEPRIPREQSKDTMH